MLVELITQVTERHALNDPSPEDLAAWANHPITKTFAERIELLAIEEMALMVRSELCYVSEKQGRVKAFEEVLEAIEEAKTADDDDKEGDE